MRFLQQLPCSHSATAAPMGAGHLSIVSLCSVELTPHCGLEHFPCMFWAFKSRKKVYDGRHD